MAVPFAIFARHSWSCLLAAMVLISTGNQAFSDFLPIDVRLIIPEQSLFTGDVCCVEVQLTNLGNRPIAIESLRENKNVRFYSTSLFNRDYDGSLIISSLPSSQNNLNHDAVSKLAPRESIRIPLFIRLTLGDGNRTAIHCFSELSSQLSPQDLDELEKKHALRDANLEVLLGKAELYIGVKMSVNITEIVGVAQETPGRSVTISIVRRCGLRGLVSLKSDTLSFTSVLKSLHGSDPSWSESVDSLLDVSITEHVLNSLRPESNTSNIIQFAIELKKIQSANTEDTPILEWAEKEVSEFPKAERELLLDAVNRRLKHHVSDPKVDKQSK